MSSITNQNIDQIISNRTKYYSIETILTQNNVKGKVAACLTERFFITKASLHLASKDDSTLLVYPLSPRVTVVDCVVVVVDIVVVVVVVVVGVVGASSLSDSLLLLEELSLVAAGAWMK